MTNYSKIGFHGTGRGIVDYLKELDAEGVPFRIKAVANSGLAMEAAKLARASGIPHSIIVRYPQPAGRANDHPLPHLIAEDAAKELFNWVKIQLDNTPELHPYKDLIRVEPTNEISTSDEDPSWVGSVLYYLAKYLNAEGWLAALGGFNNGQPEPEHWETPGMIQLLEYMAVNPGNSISVHEGKTTQSPMTTPISDLTPHIVGRFQFILWAADKLELSRPKIEVTEWGWAYNNMPDKAFAMGEVDELAKFYNRFPEVEAVYLWNLDHDPKWGQLPDKMARMIPDVTAYSIMNTFPDPDPPITPPNDNETFSEFIWNRSLDEQVLSLNLDAALQKKAVEQGFVVVSNEFRVLWDGVVYVAQAAERYFNGEYERRVYYVELEDWSNIHWINSAGGDPDIPNLELTVPLSGNYTIVDAGQFNAPRDYSNWPWSNQRHEGLDFASVTAGSLALAPKDGVVVDVKYSENGYGHYVVLGHHTPIPFRTILAHLERVTVSPGQLIRQKAPVGVVGSSGNSTGNHVHLTAIVPGLGLDGYVVEDVVDPTPHLNFSPISLVQTGNVKIGLHASADPGLATGELDVFETARPEVIKVLSNLNPSHLAQLHSREPEVVWIVRAFLSMYDQGLPRAISPRRFHDDTINDVRRCLSYIDGEIWIELHNEPNMVNEGLSGSWYDGRTFDDWFLELLAIYRNSLPNKKFLFPGMSPGPGIPGVRMERFSFLSHCTASLANSDGVADHVYWGAGGETVNDAHEAVRHYKQWLADRGIYRPHWLTEASDKSDNDGNYKGSRYLDLWRSLANIEGVAGITFFVASASNPEFDREIWVRNGRSIGIAEIVGGR